MGCYPSHWRTHSFQDGYCTTNQCVYLLRLYRAPRLPGYRLRSVEKALRLVAENGVDGAGPLGPVNHHWLVLWCFGTMEWIMTFHSVGNVIITTDELHDFSEGFKPHQTTNQTKYYGYQWISWIASYLKEHFSRGKCQGKPCRCGAHVLALPWWATLTTDLAEVHGIEWPKHVPSWRQLGCQLSLDSCVDWPQLDRTFRDVCGFLAPSS